MVKNIFDLRYLVLSCLFHLGIGLFFYHITSDHEIRTSFLVYGVHSKEEVIAFYKPVSDVGTFIPDKKPVVLKKAASVSTATPAKQEGTFQHTITQEKTEITPLVEKPVALEQAALPIIEQPEALPEKKMVVEKSASINDKNLIDDKKNDDVSPQVEIPTPLEQGVAMPIEQSLSKTLSSAISSKKKTKLVLSAQQYARKRKDQLLLYQAYIQKEIMRLWRPPVGVKKGVESLVYFSVSNQGAIEQAHIVKSSEIVIYDMSIKRVLMAFQFHQSLWGKRFTVNFRQ